jgi:methylated-DNA-[protein]-cysteine S-methyltransferase
MNEIVRYSRIDTPLGSMLLAERNDALIGAWFAGQKYFPDMGADWIEDPRHSTLERAATQLHEYFAGRRTTFDLPLELRGTPFQQAVWRAIARVPYGETASYGELARRAGAARGVRAAGAATGRNPLTIVIPCHRIVAADGGLTGYAGGLERKRALLEREARAPLGGRRAA